MPEAQCQGFCSAQANRCTWALVTRTTAQAGEACSCAQACASLLCAITRCQGLGGGGGLVVELNDYCHLVLAVVQVRVVLEGVDGRYSNLVGSLHYTDPQGGVKNLAMELVQLVRGTVSSQYQLLFYIVTCTTAWVKNMALELVQLVRGNTCFVTL